MPNPYAIVELTDNVARYMAAKYLQSKQPSVVVPIPPGWTTRMVSECDHAISVILVAVNNRLSTDWDVDRYCSKLSPNQSGQNLDIEALQEHRFPPIFASPFPVLMHPNTLTDCHGNIMVWHLPDILSEETQLNLWDDTRILGNHIAIQPHSGNWRVGPRYYRNPTDVSQRPGTVSMSPAWFEQGHTSATHNLIPSTILRESSDGQCLDWVARTQWVAAITGAILSIIHPQQYVIGRLALLELADRPDSVSYMSDVKNILRIWASPYTAISVVVNRQTPVHRDTQGRHPWMDMLLTYGPYHGARMELRSLGVRLSYDSGAIIAICGKVVPHAVSDCTGERACIAYYMRDNVHDRLNIPAGTWMNTNML